MNNESKNETKKEVKKKLNIDKRMILIGSGIALLLIIVIVVVVLLNKGEDREQDKDNTEKLYSSEETVEEEYGFSKEDAIGVIKGIYQSDNYEFSATVRADNMYIVTVTNTETQEKVNYIVDPNDKSFYLDDSEA